MFSHRLYSVGYMPSALLRFNSSSQDLLVALKPLDWQHTENVQAIKPLDTQSNIVRFEGPDDPNEPINWTPLRRWSIVVSSSLVSFVVSFGSSIWSATLPDISREFNVSQDVALLGVSLYVLGFAFGPQIFGPASELYGRKSPLWAGLIMFCILQIPLALVRDITSALVLRFLSGLAGSAPLSIITGLHVDILHPVEMGISMAIYVAAVYCGPVLGPIIGNLIVAYSLGWRWTVWITVIPGVILTAITMYLTPETAQAVILRRKARKLRLQTKNFALHSQSEENSINMHIFVTKYLTKPIVMFVKEPVLVIFTIYMSLAYGILYLTFVMYPVAFVVERGWDPTAGSLPFLGMLIGIFIACGIIAMHSLYYVRPRLLRTNQLNPEDRLPPMIFGSVLLTGGLFWFAWTSSPDILWIVQVASGVPLGCGIILVFMCAIAYLVDVYLADANSALAVNTFIRSAVAAAFPILERIMFRRLGVDWGVSVLGFASLSLMPFPILTLRYGRTIRSWSKFAAVS
ncbi:Citrinin biosynthesis cluster MFS transporter-like protein [Elsinoe fawcettii]|nr:Citrinin biosynthesis cluster MFS transporter-like protein [Elsinoe fawcettii]